MTQYQARLSSAARAAIFAAVAGTFLCSTQASAKDAMGTKPWSFNVRNNPVAAAKASMMWQATQTGNQNAIASGTGSGGLGGAGAGSSATANYSAITIVLGEGAVGNIDIGMNQDSVGDQSASSTSTTRYEGPVNLQINEAPDTSSTSQ